MAQSQLEMSKNPIFHPLCWWRSTIVGHLKRELVLCTLSCGAYGVSSMLLVLYRKLIHQSYHFTKVLTLGYEIHWESNVSSDCSLSEVSSILDWISAGEPSFYKSSFLFVSLRLLALRLAMINHTLTSSWEISVPLLLPTKDHINLSEDFVEVSSQIHSCLS